MIDHNSKLARMSVGEIDLAERIESVKAGGVGAISAGLVYAFGRLVNDWLLPSFAPLEGLPNPLLGWNWLVSGAIALFSGFLFGITYRYVIRQDKNSHLGDGAILAFGLVRGMGQVDAGLSHPVPGVWLVVIVLESIILFTVARLSLDWAIARGWLKPFGFQAQQPTTPPFTAAPDREGKSNDGATLSEKRPL